MRHGKAGQLSKGNSFILMRKFQKVPNVNGKNNLHEYSSRLAFCLSFHTQSYPKPLEKKQRSLEYELKKAFDVKRLSHRPLQVVGITVEVELARLILAGMGCVEQL